MTAVRNIAVERSATKPDKVWRLLSGGQPLDGTGSVFALTVTVGRVTVVSRTTADGSGRLTYDQVTGRVRWWRTLAESGSIPVGLSGEYYLERLGGVDVSVLIKGGVGGLRGVGDV